MVSKLSDCSVTEYEVCSKSYQTTLLQNTRYGQLVIRYFCYRIRGMVNKISECSVTEYQIWSIRYQTVLLQNTRYGQ